MTFDFSELSVLDGKDRVGSDNEKKCLHAREPITVRKNSGLHRVPSWIIASLLACTKGLNVRQKRGALARNRKNGLQSVFLSHDFNTCERGVDSSAREK